MKTIKLIMAIAIGIAAAGCNGAGNNAVAQNAAQQNKLSTNNLLASRVEDAVSAQAAQADAQLVKSLNLIFDHKYHTFKLPDRTEIEALTAEQWWVKNTIKTILDDHNRSVLYRSYAGKIEFIDDLHDRAEDLWHIDEAGTTASMQLNAELECAIDMFTARLALAGLIEKASNKQLASLLSQEACVLQAFTHAASQFAGNIAMMNNWQGSITKVSVPASIGDVVEAHKDLLEDELTDSYDTEDDLKYATIARASENLIASCEMAIKVAEEQNVLSSPDEYSKVLSQAYNNLNTIKSLLPELISYRAERVRKWAPTMTWSQRWITAQDHRLIDYLNDIAEECSKI